MSLCGGSWFAGIAGYGSVLLSRDWLITVEAHGHPGHQPSTQLDAVVNLYYMSRHRNNQILQSLEEDCRAASHLSSMRNSF